MDEQIIMNDDKNKTIAEVQTEVNREIDALTGDTIKELINMWTELYEPSICICNTRTLATHVETFYKEILLETEEKKIQYLNDIKDLKEEALKLRRLLKVDIKIDTNDNLPLFTLKHQLNESLEDLRKILIKRKNEIYKLRLEQEELCDELNENKLQLNDDPLPSENELNEFRLHLNNLKLLKNERINNIQVLQFNIKKLIKDLEIFGIPDEEEFLLKNESPTSETIYKLKKMNEFYEQQLIKMKDDIDLMIKKIKKLWKCLNYDLNNFNKKYDKYFDKYTQTTYDIFYQELERCENEKKQNIKIFVDKLREEIQKLWELCLKSDIERKRFIHFTNDYYTEDLLELHEREIDDLKTFYEENKKIFTLYEERQNLWERMIALEINASAPDRLNNRGGRLLQEEKERKFIATKLPKIEEKLRELVVEYENRNRRKFTVYGEDIIELIEKQWEKRREDKEKLMSARKNATGIRTPLSVKNHQITGIGGLSGSTMKKATSIRNISSVPLTHKRQLTEKDLINPKAKRKLLDINEGVMLQSPKPLLKSANKSTAQKLKSKPKRVIASVIKSQSDRYSSARKNRKRKSRGSKPIPKIIVSDDTMPSESTSYDIFQQRIEKDPSSRSSIVLKDNSSTIITNTKATPRLTRSRAAKISSRLPTPKKPSRNKQQQQQKQYTKSSTIINNELSHATAQSPMAGPSGTKMTTRKLTAKEVPILF